MKKIHLYGALKKYGDFNLNVKSAYEAIRLLSVQIDGFSETINSGDWKIYYGNIEDKNLIPLSAVKMICGENKEIHIMPCLEGEKGGTGKIIAGGLLAASALIPGGPLAAGFTVGGFTVSAGTIAMVGGAIALGGIASALTKTSSYSSDSDDDTSYSFGGPENVASQGGCVPLVYGKMIIGSTVISSGLSVEDYDPDSY